MENENKTVEEKQTRFDKLNNDVNEIDELTKIYGIGPSKATDLNKNHNIKTVEDLIENPKASVEDLTQFIQAPDFPTGAEIITPPEQLQQIYTQGKGSFKRKDFMKPVIKANTQTVCVCFFE